VADSITLRSFGFYLPSDKLDHEIMDGRYFDPESGVVYHDSAFVLEVTSRAFLLAAVLLRSAALKIKGKTPAKVAPTRAVRAAKRRKRKAKKTNRRKKVEKPQNFSCKISDLM
jgi:hypothetical protein